MKGFRGLTPDQTEELAREGVVRVARAIPSADVDTMLGTLWRRIETRCGAVRDRPQTWRVERPSKLGAAAEDFAAMGAPAVRAVLDDLLGPGGWVEPPRWAVPLVAFPRAGPWELPHRDWHLDLPATADPPRVARVFAVLARSEPHGGATVYVAGSHRLLRKMAAQAGRPLPSADARRALAAAYPWFADLGAERPGEDRVRRFMGDGAVVDGVAVRVREMLGEPGDLIVMDPMMLHTPTPNVRTTPRMMLTALVRGKA